MRSFWQWLLRIESPDSDIRRRAAMLALLACTLICFAVLTIPLSLTGEQPLISTIVVLVGVICYSAVLFMARRGLVTAGGFLFIGMLMAGIFTSLAVSGGTALTAMFLVIPLIIGGLILRPAQIWIVLVAILAGIGAVIATRPLGLSRDYLTQMIAAMLLQVIVTVLSFFGARAINAALAEASAARLAAERAAEHLTQLNNDLEARVDERTHALRTALEAGEARETHLRSLLDENAQQASTIREMSVPTIPISASMLVMPLIGALDSARLELIQQQALEAIQSRRAQLLILDVTGVPIIDTQVAKGLLMVTQATRLLGAEVMLVGVQPEVAQTIVGLGITFEGLRTASDLQSVLQRSP